MSVIQGVVRRTFDRLSRPSADTRYSNPGRLRAAEPGAYSCLNTSTGFTCVEARAGMNVATAMTSTIMKAAAV